MEYYSATERREVLTHAPSWLNLGDVMLTDEGRGKRTNITPLMWGAQVRQAIETESRMVTSRVWR